MPYHMRRSEKEITDWSAIEEVISKGKYATLSLARNSEPYGVTLNYGYEQTTRSLYFHCALEGLKTDFVIENSSVCATIIEDNGYLFGECDHAFRSVVIRGKIEILSADADKMHGLEVMLDHLEKDPNVKRERLPAKAELDKVAIWRLTIVEVSGKQRS